MGRTKGAINKETQQPEEYILTSEQRLKLIADLLIEIITEEGLCNPQ